MTNLEALQATIGSNYPLNPNAYVKALLDAPNTPGLLALNPTDDYVSDNAKTVDICAAGLIWVLLTSPQSIKEGGYEITNASAAALQATRTMLLGKYGIPSGTSFIQNLPNKW